MTNSTYNSGPIFKDKVGRLHISVFENLDEKKGQVFFSTYINRRYEKDGRWVNGYSFSEADLDDLANARKLARQAIAERKQKLSKQQLPQAKDPSWTGDIQEPGTKAA